jgi:hypothetical protein
MCAFIIRLWNASPPSASLLMLVPAEEAQHSQFGDA